MATHRRSFGIATAGAALALALAVAPAASADTPRGAGAALWEDRSAGDALHGIEVEHRSAAAASDTLQQEIASLGDGEPLTVAEPGPFDALLRAVGRLPEPATWGLMILGFGAIGGAMRRRMRHSEAAFTAHVRRIASGDGEDGQD